MSQTEPRGRLEFLERELEGYREYVADWKHAHDALSQCWAVEGVIGKANYVFRGISHLRADLNRIALSEQAPEIYVRRFHLLRQWLDLSESLMSEFVPQLQREHGEVEDAMCLRTNIEIARAEIQSPERVEIDGDGYVYEPTGERAIVPGVNPERLARSIRDASAARTRSLKDIIAARGSRRRSDICRSFRRMTTARDSESATARI
jgi:hypothetical protein